MQIVDLNNFDLIAIEGIEAKKFLQGQITCDVDKLTPSHSLEGAICNIKGRVIADFRLLEFQDICYLQLAADMANIVKPVLDKYMVFSRAESSIASNQFKRIGILGELNSTRIKTSFEQFPDEEGKMSVSGNTILIKVPGLIPRHELWQFNPEATDQDGFLNNLLDNEETISSNHWDLEDIRAGLAHVTPALAEQHLPEALNYDISGVISFTKGCYTGQEIVARMHYRGTAKKRLFCGISAESAEQPETIDVLVTEKQTTLPGELLNSARDENGKWLVLAVLPTVTEDPGARIYLNGNPDSPVELLSLPYVTD